ncbi:MAG: DUF1491 family protein [Alphaproteobacteria bacterium]|nr:MAG: DUF1491 family protein [Alphaproteobacteria bacterium]
MDKRLPAHLEVSAIIRMVEAGGGFATLVARGERDAGTILLLTLERDETATLYERMPQLDGTRPYIAAKRENSEKPTEMDEYIARRRSQDPDIWVIEANVADAERFIATLPD